MQKFTKFALFVVLALSVLCASATDVAVLRNGFSIRHERRAVLGSVTRLYISADGSNYVDVPTADIDHFEQVTPVAAASGSIDKRTGILNSATSPGVPVDLNSVIAQASGKYRLDPDLVNSVIKAESGFKVHAVSSKGAQGLMQLMPGTASELGVRNAFDPNLNVDAGARYLRELLERYNFDLIKALAAYNAGPLRVEEYGGVPPYYETRTYVSRIVRDFNRKKTAEEKNSKKTLKNAAQETSRTVQAQATGSASSRPVTRSAASSLLPAVATK